MDDKETAQWEELISAFHKFMHTLKDDVKRNFDADTPLMMKLDVKLTVRKEDEIKLKAYEPRLNKLLNSMPSDILPIKVAELESELK